MRDFEKNGFSVIKIHKENKLKNLRTKFIKIFSKISEINGGLKIKSDKKILDLYKRNKKLWVGAYDQIRLLPEVYTLIDQDFLNKIEKSAGIKIPAFTSKPVVRVYMPKNIGTTKTVPHIDYPSHRGSKNAVTVWFPLQSLNSKSGTLKILPGSHKFKTISGSIDKGTVKRLDLSDRDYENQMQHLNIKIGEAIIMSQFLVHSSGDNNSDSIRFSIDFRLNDLNEKSYALRKYYVNQLSYYRKR